MPERRSLPGIPGDPEPPRLSRPPIKSELFQMRVAPEFRDRLHRAASTMGTSVARMVQEVMTWYAERLGEVQGRDFLLEVRRGRNPPR